MLGERLRAMIGVALLAAAVTLAGRATPTCAQQAPSKPAPAPANAAAPTTNSSPAPAVDTPPATSSSAAAPVNTPPAEPTPEAKERARAAYARGQAAFAQGDYAQAKSAFEQAFASVPNPIVLISVAESAAKSGAIADAIAAYDHYLQLKPDAADRADIEAKRAALAATPAQLAIVTEPPGADVLIDGRPLGKQTPADITLAVGDHQLKCTLAGYEDALDVIHAQPGGHEERRIVLKRPIPPPVAVAPAPAAPLALATPPGKVPTAALWVTGSIGAAGLIAGTVLGIMALKEHNNFNENPTTESADRGERLALFADVGFGVGAMALVTAVVLLFDREEAVPAAGGPTASGQARSASARLQLIPQVSSSSAAATARVRF